MNLNAPASSAPRSNRDKMRDWFAEGAREGYGVMLICMDTFDAFRDEDCGVYRACFASLEEARAYAAENLAISGWGASDLLMEVFDLGGDFDTQFDEWSKEGVARFWTHVS